MYLDMDNIDYWLRKAFNDYHVQITRKDRTFPELDPHFLDILTVVCEGSPPRVTLRQYDILRHTYTTYVDENGDEIRLTQMDIANMLGISVRTLQMDLREAKDRIIQAVNRGGE